MVKQFLSQNGVNYEEKDVSKNRAYAQELVSKTGQMGVPVTVIDNETVIGFDKPRLEQLLPRMKPPPPPAPPLGASIADAGKITADQGKGITLGAYVGKVKPGSVAQRIGLAPDDIITKVNLRDIANAGDLARELSRLQAGNGLSLVFLRNGQTMTGETTL